MKGYLQALLSMRNEHRILGLMLVMLHWALWWSFGGALSRSLMLAHLGLFLIWQPLWSRELRLTWSGLIVFLLTTVAFILWLNWTLMTFWVLLLTGVVGGRVTATRGDRVVYLMTLLFLVSELFLFPAHEDSRRPARTMDFLYGLSVSMVAAILALGSLLGMYYTGEPYAVALFQTVLGIALFLLAISWLWAPLAGFSGLGQLWERYLLNIGTPFERWLGRLANLSRRRQTPPQFLRSAMRQFGELDWVAGVEWDTPDDSGMEGTRTPHSFRFVAGELRTRVYTRRPIGAALLLHGKLLMQLVGHFHRAKQREQELTERAHLQAIYETGARVTHDIKNLLQSLHGITVALEQSPPERRQEVQQLLQRQLPHVQQRLQLALDKLQTPEDLETTEVALSEWWDALQSRNAGENIRFDAELTVDPAIPLDLFDSVAENLLENARYKRQSEPGVEISVRLAASAEGISLKVKDTGSAVHAEVAPKLFVAPVRSRSGLGIGLYQAAKQARQMGYELRLREHRQGEVCFELRTAEQTEAAAASG